MIRRNSTLLGKTAAILALGFLLLPLGTLAAQDEPSLWPMGYWGPVVSCTGDGQGPTGKTCTSLCDLLVTVKNLIYVVMSLTIFVFAPVFILYGGIMILISAGSESRISDGKKIITGTVIGIALALLAFLIVQTVINIAVEVNPGTSLRGWANFSCTPGKDVPAAIK